MIDEVVAELKVTLLDELADAAEMRGNNRSSRASWLMGKRRMSRANQGDAVMDCLLASGDPFQIVVVPLLFVVAILAAGVCLMVCAVALILGIVLASRRPKRQGDEAGDGSSRTSGWD